MSHPQVTVIGAGNVGATTAQRIAEAGLADVVLVDIVEGLPQGKALDLAEAAPVLGHDCAVRGTNDYADTAGSDVIVVTSGLARQPGMSRDDLMAKNAGIVGASCEQAAAASPNAILIVVTNPLDAMCHVALAPAASRASGCIGMAGVLDTARFRSFIASELGVSVTNTHAFVLGGHGDTMVPLPRYSTVGWRAHHGAAQPGAHRRARRPHPQRRRRGRGAAQDRQRLLRARRVRVPDGRAILNDRGHPALRGLLQGEYGVDGLFVGVPVKLGRRGHRGDHGDRADRRRAGGVRRSAAAVQGLVDHCGMAEAAGVLRPA